jgi:hypothetical protein
MSSLSRNAACPHPANILNPSAGIVAGADSGMAGPAEAVAFTAMQRMCVNVRPAPPPTPLPSSVLLSVNGSVATPT